MLLAVGHTSREADSLLSAPCDCVVMPYIGASPGISSATDSPWSELVKQWD